MFGWLAEELLSSASFSHVLLPLVGVFEVMSPCALLDLKEGEGRGVSELRGGGTGRPLLFASVRMRRSSSLSSVASRGLDSLNWVPRPAMRARNAVDGDRSSDLRSSRRCWWESVWVVLLTDCIWWNRSFMIATSSGECVGGSGTGLRSATWCSAGWSWDPIKGSGMVSGSGVLRCFRWPLSFLAPCVCVGACPCGLVCS